VDLKIRGFKGKNWRFLLKPLTYHVDPANCRIQVKSSSISITLKKEDKQHWINLTKKSGPSLGSKASAGRDEESAYPSGNQDDPSDSLMQMMKNLYDTGDEDMKRTIAESFAKARSGQIPPLGSPAASQLPPAL